MLIALEKPALAGRAPLHDPGLFSRNSVGEGTQIQVIGSKVAGRPTIDRRISAACKVGPMTPAGAFAATLS